MKLFRSKAHLSILLLNALILINILFFTFTSISSGIVQIIRLTQSFGLVAFLFLYLALLAAPFCYTFRELPFCKQYLEARGLLITSSLVFALLHSSTAFFFQLGGITGLSYLSSNYIIAILLAFIALLLLMALSSSIFKKTEVLIKVIPQKVFSSFSYIAGILLLIHAVMLGTHFQELYSLIPQIFFAAFAFFLFLELLRLNAVLKKRLPQFSLFHPLTIPLFAILGFGILYFLIPIPSTENISFGIHAEHIRLAKEAQQGGFLPSGGSPETSSIPGLNGDRTKRYTVDFDHPEIITPGEEIPLTFTVYDASSGHKVELFNKLYEKIVHMIVVDNTLSYFNHIHPEQNGASFTITTTFPENGRYHIYLDFQPFGAIEQQMAFTLNVGDTSNLEEPRQSAEKSVTKTFGDYQVTLDFPKPLQAKALSIGQQEMSFTIRDAITKNPITTLKPYLGAYGHLVLINQETYDYVHVHPSILRPPRPEENGGPTVKFLPLGLYGPIKQGTYRVFAQFNPDNNLFTSDFTINVE